MKTEYNTYYSYQALPTDGKYFRLLSIEPGVRDDDIKCSLSNAVLTRAGELQYETISYCWGDRSSREQIQVNGKSFDAPASSVAALRRVRSPMRRRRLWIDAICINQDDLLERAQQVSLMGDLYSSSQGNLICLGEPSGTESEALASIQAICEEAEIETNGFVGLRSALWSEDGSTQYSESGLTCQPNYKALQSFYSKPWFSRLWVIQEVVLAPHSQCLCGAHEIDLLDVLLAGSWLGYKSTCLPLEFMREVPSGMRNINTLLARVDRHERFVKPKLGGTFNMSGLLDFGRHRLVAVPHDRIYGMLGLYDCYDGDIAGQGFQVDYQAPLQTVLCKATKIALWECRRNLDVVFEHVSHRSNNELDSWASWIPRWDRQWDWTIDSSDLSYKLYDCDLSSAASEDLFDMSNNAAVILMRGICVGKAQLYSAVLTRKIATDAAEYLIWLDKATEIAQCADGILGLTLAASSNFDAVKMSSTEDAPLQRLREYMALNGSVPDIGDLQPEDNPDILSLSRYDSAIWYASGNRRVFATSTGEIGVGPKVMQEGDMIVVLYGARLPQLLRRSESDGRYRLLGQCYVHGIMHGEAVKAHRAAGGADEIFAMV